MFWKLLELGPCWRKWVTGGQVFENVSCLTNSCPTHCFLICYDAHRLLSMPMPPSMNWAILPCFLHLCGLKPSESRNHIVSPFIVVRYYGQNTAKVTLILEAFHLPYIITRLHTRTGQQLWAALEQHGSSTVWGRSQRCTSWDCQPAASHCSSSKWP